MTRTERRAGSSGGLVLSVEDDASRLRCVATVAGLTANITETIVDVHCKLHNTPSTASLTYVTMLTYASTNDRYVRKNYTVSVRYSSVSLRRSVSGTEGG